ncbi:succinyl-CoA synthetase, beta subunit [Acidimicrobium ferrooxidans DSM 10331]|uniref:Succinate--CoA ligase [ADP-forming] subunit beta n=1 Tax=Acidimicrobium ferrooxidans (strain DSM 10331 / JCM 15462 / NBRC 103882 / ICP) TaxID=525909 RepID=C7M2P3_ACIFD|nr:ADP-forming succinate--CoA ligase subunit beta [Acidimicrobium ferrooxidans]ACU53287.1 succinyl-CoA synthetase, beta subunit [Acidimicrobium ferrooxidans DSM 10331]
MDLKEYQGKDLFRRFGVPTSEGRVCVTVEEAVAAAETLGYPVVVKAQVLVGGRGKAGGVRVAATEEALREAAGAILGMDLKGHRVKEVWIEPASDIRREYYASFTLDRTARQYLLMLSAMGGVDIEEVARTHPEAIARVHIDPIDGLTPALAEQAVATAGIDEGREELPAMLGALYRAFVEGDADLVEVNPLIVRSDGKLWALDAKVTLDDSAAFRHPEWEAYRADEELDSREAIARARGLNYIGLEGSVGIIANGAGLAMSTLDVVQQVGGRAANFLDLGGGAGADTMTAALEVIATDPQVRALLVNIFGGITRCDEVARGIVAALERVRLPFPMVVRLDGTNAAEGRAILSSVVSDSIIVEPTMIKAAERAVAEASKAVA